MHGLVSAIDELEQVNFSKLGFQHTIRGGPVIRERQDLLLCQFHGIQLNLDTQGRGNLMHKGNVQQSVLAKISIIVLIAWTHLHMFFSHLPFSVCHNSLGCILV